MSILLTLKSNRIHSLILKPEWWLVGLRSLQASPGMNWLDLDASQTNASRLLSMFTLINLKKDIILLQELLPIRKIFSQCEIDTLFVWLKAVGCEMKPPLLPKGYQWTRHVVAFLERMEAILAIEMSYLGRDTIVRIVLLILRTDGGQAPRSSLLGTLVAWF